MSAPTHSHPWLHRLAVSTVCVAMLTVIAGALVTSKNAGMAFRDWPTSDGQNMLTYPWLSDFSRDGDKFLEHGHRLAGMLIGCWSILLAVVTWVSTKQRSLRLLSVGILLGVICQGILGGFRVQLDERGLALVHGLFASIVFSLMGSMVVLTSRGWTAASETRNLSGARGSMLLPSAVGLVIALLLQYLLGGFIRHRGSGLHEHLGLGLLLPVLAMLNAVIAARSGVGWLTRSGLLTLTAVFAQASLGGLTWILKFGFAPSGFVATADSIGQVLTRTSHMVFGVVVMMTAVTHLVKVCRVLAFVPREMPELFIDRPLRSGGAV